MASYTPVSVSGYNSSPPVDDGTVTESNRIKWSTIKTKLSDPLNTAIGTLDDNIAAAITTITANLASSVSTANTHTDTYETRVENLYAPGTTKMLFIQTAAPTGWTKGTTHNDKALRLVSGVAGTGGNEAFSDILDGRALVTENLPAHTHTWSSGTITCSVSINGNTADHTLITSVSENNHSSLANASASTHIESISDDTDTISATASFTATASDSAGGGEEMDFDVLYCDVIMATKD